ncbi:MAG TPA: MBL fold metallo-hydrolase [Anaerolineae bacterium]|nr:MBL fold metallo-hydrolase [Anaerolineae bacterium]
MIRITCLVDNSAQRSSGFWAEHGLSFLIETKDGRVLFDAGQSRAVLMHNLQVFGIDPASIDALALSHGHYDHMGGLPAVLRHISRLSLYANSDLFRERFTRQGAVMKRIGPSMRGKELAQYADCHLSDSPQEILPGLFTTGEVVSRSEPEGRSGRHVVREGAAWIADPYRDDMSLVLTAGQGLVLVCGCCHAGLLNTLQHVRATFEGRVVAVLGGLHLAQASAEQLDHTTDELHHHGVQQLYPNHCTGERAYTALANAFGDRVVPCPAGSVVTF